MSLHSVNLEHLKSKHNTDMGDISLEEETIVEKEMPSLEADTQILQNELIVTESRLQNIQKEKKQLERSNLEYQKLIDHVLNFKTSVEWKESKENEEMQHFEVRLYNQTIIQHSLQEEMEALLEFMIELIKRHQGDNTAQDAFVFQQLCQSDQERVSELLYKVGIKYQVN